MRVEVIENRVWNNGDTLAELVAGLSEWHREQGCEAVGAAAVVPGSKLPSSLGVDAQLLLVALPELAVGEASALAASELFVFNNSSHDLLENDTYIGFFSSSMLVAVNAWHLSSELDLDLQLERLYVGFVAGDRLLIARHVFNRDDVDELLGSLQGAMSSSGANYRPHRMWSEAELEAAAASVPPDVDMFNEMRLVRCKLAVFSE